MQPQNRKIFLDPFVDLRHWYLEGGGKVYISERGVLRLECTGSEQGGVGCMAFCRQDFPDRIAVNFHLRVHQKNGLLITFVAVRGLHGEDILRDLPPRRGEFREYTGNEAPMRSYHVSLSRYDDAGQHTGVSNWRRNPGLHLMAQGPDLCREINRPYAVRIEKEGPGCAVFVDGVPGPSFTDPGALPDELPASGKIGFRAIGSNVVADISNFEVSVLGRSEPQ
ncbi:MAG: DUF1961 family protein [Candidatus Hydrogenedentes bacterium]|nr:DUF1961 family protein [Candidatus Hydrogenedentota bacterium]